jgi:hypothetical protein
MGICRLKVLLTSSSYTYVLNMTNNSRLYYQFSYQ